MKKLILMALVCSAALYSSAQGYFGIKPIVNEPTCYGASTGSIQLSLVGGTGPFNYAWSGSLPNTNQQTNLPAGTYSVTATDANNLTSSYSIVVAQPFQINANPTSNISSHGQNNGFIDLAVDGGTPGYTYLWSDGETTADISNLPAGHYSCTITDAAGCAIQYGQDIQGPLYHGTPTNNGNNDPRDLSATGNGSQTSTSNNLPTRATLKGSDVSIFPNPATSAFTLRTGEVKDAQISVIDVNGQVVARQKAESNESNLNVASLPNGNYIIEVRAENGSVVNKTVTIAK